MSNAHDFFISEETLELLLLLLFDTRKLPPSLPVPAFTAVFFKSWNALSNERKHASVITMMTMNATSIVVCVPTNMLQRITITKSFCKPSK